MGRSSVRLVRMYPAVSPVNETLAPSFPVALSLLWRDDTALGEGGRESSTKNAYLRLIAD